MDRSRSTWVSTVSARIPDGSSGPSGRYLVLKTGSTRCSRLTLGMTHLGRELRLGPTPALGHLQFFFELVWDSQWYEKEIPPLSCSSQPVKYHRKIMSRSRSPSSEAPSIESATLPQIRRVRAYKGASDEEVASDASSEALESVHNPTYSSCPTAEKSS